MQIACVIPEEELTARKVQGLLIASITIAIALYVSVFTDYVRQVAKNNFVEWDVRTVTAADFSIEFDLTDTQTKEARAQGGEPTHFYGRFIALHGHGKPANVPMAAHFRDWLQTEMEKKLSAMPDLGFEDPPPERIEIAATTFAFENGPLIGLLKQRGAAVRADKFDEMRKIDAQINDYKNAHLEDCTRPCSVFMTFETEEGYQRATQFNDVVENSTLAEVQGQKMWLGDQEIDIQEASEPSDIIWENRRWTAWQRTKGEIVAALVIGFALLLSFAAVFAGRKMQAGVYARYPAPPSCAPYYDNYGDDLVNFAVVDYEANSALEAEGKDPSYAGYLQCFCDKEARDGVPSDTTYPDQSGGEVAACADYSFYAYLALGIGNGITGFIVVVNTLLTTLAIGLITWIGYDTHSEMLTKITNGVFLAQFFNTALVLLLVEANFTETFTFAAGAFNGAFPDYVPAWYALTGDTFVQTMLINAFFPLIMQVIADLQVWFGRRQDQGWEKDAAAKPYATKLTQVSQYVQAYSGPAYIVHFKYSSVFNCVYVTMLYGVGLPIMFPIAVLSLGIFWSLERYHMAYTYQLPPSLDDRLTKNAVRVLKFSPVMLLANGYWMLGQSQIFDGWVNVKATTLAFMPTGHDFATLGRVGQATPLLLLTGAMLLIFLAQAFFKKALKRWGFGFSGSKIEVDENLPNFYKAVKLSEADWLVAENAYYSDQYQMKMITEELAAKLDATAVARKPIQGIHWYRPLANPAYAQAFAYISVNTPDRANLIVDDDDNEDNDCEQSDMVNLVLNMAFISDSIVRECVFGAGLGQSIRGHNMGAAAVGGLYKAALKDLQ